VLSPGAKTITKLALLAGTLGFAAPVGTVKPFPAYHDGEKVMFAPEHTGTNRMASFGPWNLGERLSEGKPLDNRLNLYVVVPGGQYHSAARPEYDHNRVVNKYTVDGKVREWDIFYCFVIDPSLSNDFRSETDLLMAAHQTFVPPDLFDISDVPANSMLAEKLGVTSMAELRHYRKKGRGMPRVLIVPARLAVRATAEQPDVIITHVTQ
jgi:hypothetical protein